MRPLPDGLRPLVRRYSTDCTSRNARGREAYVAPGKKVKLALAAAVVSLLTLPISSWATQGHTPTFKANLSLHSHGGFFDGHVGTAHVCQAGRVVTVSLMGGGPVGTAVTDHSGDWAGVSVPGAGTYVASVTEEVRGGYQGADCLAGSSHQLTVQ